MYEYIIIGNDDFGTSAAKAIGCEFREFRSESYPDGEPYVVVEADYDDIEGKDAIVVSRMSDQSNRESILSYLHEYQRVIGNIADKELYNARTVYALYPYFCLGRQDKNPRTETDEKIRKRDRGKDIGYKYIIKTLKGLGAERIITYDPHFLRGETSKTIDKMRIDVLSGIYSLARYFENIVDDSTAVLSPDMGASTLSQKLADLLNIKPIKLSKKRLTDKIVESSTVYDAEGHNIIIVDDIISTAGTLTKSIENIENAGEIIVACIHPVLPKVGYNRLIELKKSGVIKDIIATDTINSEFSKASVIPELAKYFQVTI
jgi:ribose-phosphate pyrophosphokinase